MAVVRVPVSHSVLGKESSRRVYSEVGYPLCDISGILVDETSRKTHPQGPWFRHLECSLQRPVVPIVSLFPIPAKAARVLPIVREGVWDSMISIVLLVRTFAPIWGSQHHEEEGAPIRLKADLGGGAATHSFSIFAF